MGKPHAVRKVHPVGVKQDDGVTPVIGAILILAITVLGIAGVLLWGAPLIDRIQARNAQSAMVGEFEDLRDASRELSVPDHSRFPTVVLSRGEITLEGGSRIMVSANHDTGFSNCDFHIKDWADTTAPTQVTIQQGAACRTASTTVVTYSVSGSTVVQIASQAASNGASTITAAGYDFSEGDWVFRLVNAASCPNYCAEAWIVSTDRLTWDMEGTSGSRSVMLDAGAIFSIEDGTTFLAKEPVIGDTAFGSSYYGLWLRTLNAANEAALSGAGSHQVYLSLVGNHVRTDTSSVSRLRFDISGDLAEAWCNSLIERNNDLAGDYRYEEDSTMTCAAGGTGGVRSVCYASTVSGNSCSSSPSATFTFKFLHARIYTSLVV